MPRFEADRTLCFAHRGYSELYPENTLPAFEAALDAGADGVELDVGLTADGRLAVMHDATLDRTTTGTGSLAGRRALDLAELDAGSWFDPQFMGTPVPMLEDVFDLLGGKLLINVEIKPEAGHPAEERVADLIRNRGLVESVLVSSFNYQTLLRLRSYAPDIKLGVLCHGDEANISHADLLRAIDAFSLHPNLARVPQALVRQVQAEGRRVYAWVPQGNNGQDSMRRAFAASVDGYFANDPEMFLRIRASS